MRVTDVELTLRSRNHLDQNYKLSLYHLIFDGGVGAQQSEAENAVEHEQALDGWFLAVTIVEKRYVDAEHLSDLLEPRRADPVDALFVFLHLLETDIEVLSQSYGRSPDTTFGCFQDEIADSLRRIFEIFPFSGDCGWRPGSICTAWRARQCNSTLDVRIILHQNLASAEADRLQQTLIT